MKHLGRIYAKLNLAVALVIHVVFKKWFRRRGLKHFLANYANDHIFFLTQEDRNHYSSYGRCIQCGFCVTECQVTDFGVADPGFYEQLTSPSQIAFSYTRSLPEVSLNTDFVSHCRACRACEVVCPTGVPLNRMVEFVKYHDV